MASAVITTPIPRFLLPRATCFPVIRKALYRPRSSSSGASSSYGHVRHASKKPRGNDGDKTIVLEKPLKFNPPSHGSRLPNKSGPRHYGGTLSDAEIKAQARKDYPGLPPPPGTFGYKFWNSPVIHMYITIGTLGSLAIYTLSARFMETSPFASMVPSAYDFLRHPIESISTCAHIVLLHADWNTAQTMEKRRGSIEDVTKRRKYRRAHGIEDETVAQKLLPESWTKPTEESMEAAYGDGTVIEEVTKKDGGDGNNEERKKSWGSFFGA